MLDKEWLATFAAVGRIPAPGQWQPTGACFFLLFNDLVWLVTAKHVVPSDAAGLGVLVPIDGKPTLLNLTEIMANTPGVTWIIDPKHDVAVAPMPTPPGISIKAIVQAQSLRIEELLPSMSCLTAGCPHGLPGVSRETMIPLVLNGVIAGKDTASRTIFISTPTFPGSIGGPIIVIRSPFNAAGGATIGLPTVFLAGIVSQVQTVQANDPQSVPLRLGVGVAVDVIFDLLSSTAANEIVQTIKGLGR
jgi:hypothetical protein